MLEKLRPIDLIAVVLIFGYIFLAWRGFATMLNSAVMIIVGFYFGAEHQRISNKE